MQSFSPKTFHYFISMPQSKKETENIKGFASGSLEVYHTLRKQSLKGGRSYEMPLLRKGFRPYLSRFYLQKL